MKNLLALLLMALLLVPALAMADMPSSIPSSINVDHAICPAGSPPPSSDYIVNMNSRTNSRTLSSVVYSSNGDFYVHQSGDYIATYYLSGQLKTFTYAYPIDSGYVEVQYASDGTPLHASVKISKSSQGSGYIMKYEYAPETGWIDTETDEVVDPVYDLNDRKQLPLPAGVGTAANKAIRPPLDVLTVLKDAGYKFDSFEQLMGLSSLFNDSTGVKTVYTNGNKRFVKTSYSSMPIYAYYKDNDLIEWYVGPVSFHVASKQIWVIGVDAYGINTSGRYHWDNGELIEYTIYSSDRSMVAGYTAKNVLQSYELWDKSGAYWGYFDGKWEYAQSGSFLDVVEKDPTTEVLEKILHAPVPATYTSSCVTSTKGFDSEGVPYIIADMEATPVITAKQLESDLRATEFDITLEDKEGQPTQPDAPVTLTLAYPAGMTQGIVNKGDYEIAVVHDNKDVMSTVAGNVTLTSDGPQVTASSFSPYTVVWGTADELRAKFPGSIPSSDASLPRTGDNSQLPLFAGLLAVSAIALAAILLKRRAHQ